LKSTTGFGDGERAPVHVDIVTEGTLMTTGTVSFYNAQKGFGFIQPDHFEKEILVRAAALQQAGISGLTEGQLVEFEKMIDTRDGKIAVGTLKIR
jgi:CspA family cold shock protein